MLTHLGLVFIGGGGGAVFRHLMQQAVGPWGVFAVNITGGLLLGLLIEALALRGGIQAESWRLLLAVGVLGGFTTFSAFSLELALMLERGDWLNATGYAAASVIAATAALMLGMAVARALS